MAGIAAAITAAGSVVVVGPGIAAADKAGPVGVAAVVVAVVAGTAAAEEAAVQRPAVGHPEISVIPARPAIHVEI